MTKFINYYSLCPIHNPTEVLGISSDRDEENIIATLGRNIVVIIQINNQKQIHSWSTLEKLSSKVVYDRKSNKYVGVFANSFIRCWDETSTDISKNKRIKFNKHIADLVAHGETTYVVYVDGTCEELESAILSRKNSESLKLQSGVSSMVVISDAKVSTLLGGGKCLTFFEKHQNEDALTLVKVDLSDKGLSSKVHRYLLKRENLDVNVAGYAVIEGDDGPTLLTIWSDKRIFLLSLNDTVVAEKSPGNFVSMLNELKVDTSLSIIGVSRNFIVIYGANSSQEGASLLLYNTQFKVAKAKQFFKIYFNSSRLWTENNHVLLVMGQSLSVVSYRISKELLSDFVGTQYSNSLQTAIENDHINEDDPLHESIQIAQSPAEVKKVSLKPKEKRSELYADGKTIPFEAVSNFEQELISSSMFDMHVDIVHTNKSYEDLQINFTSNVYDDGFPTSNVQLIANQLENGGASEHEISEKLLGILIKSNLLQDIAVCLRRYTNISEKMLVRTLKYVLCNISNKIHDLDETIHDMDAEYSHTPDVGNGLLSDSAKEVPNSDIFLKRYVEVPVIKDHADVLNIILCCSFDDAAIAPHVRKEIDYQQVLFMFEYLYAILTNEHMCDPEIYGFGKECIDIEPLVLRWFGVFLNTHFQKLALSKDVHLLDTLYKWHELFKMYKREIVELEQVAALLYNLVERKKIFKEKNYSKWYSIEEVDLY